LPTGVRLRVARFDEGMRGAEAVEHPLDRQVLFDYQPESGPFVHCEFCRS